MCLLLFAIASGILFVATIASQPGGLLAAALYISSFIFALVGLAVGVDAYLRMTQHQAFSTNP